MMRQQGGFIPLPLILYAVAGLAIIAALWGVYHSIDKRGYERGITECRAAAAVQRDREIEAGAGASTQLEKSNEKARVVYRTITQSVDHYIDRPVYRNACFDSDGLLDANAALRGARTAPGKPDDSVPGSDRARGPDGGDDPPETDRGR